MEGNRFLPLLGLPYTDPDVRATLRALQQETATTSLSLELGLQDASEKEL